MKLTVVSANSGFQSTVKISESDLNIVPSQKVKSKDNPFVVFLAPGAWITFENENDLRCLRAKLSEVTFDESLPPTDDIDLIN